MAEERVVEVGERTAHIEGLVVGMEKRLSNVEIEVRELRGEMKNLRSDMKAEISGLRTELKGEISGLRAEMDRRFTELKEGIHLRFESMEKRFTTLQWVVVLIYPLLIAIAGKLFLMK